MWTDQSSRSGGPGVADAVDLAGPYPMCSGPVVQCSPMRHKLIAHGRKSSRAKDNTGSAADQCSWKRAFYARARDDLEEKGRDFSHGKACFGVGAETL